MARGHGIISRGRSLAVLSCLTLGLLGCSSAGYSPLGNSFTSLIPDRDAIATTAESLPYASVAAHMDGNDALMIMAHQVGEDTFWQARDRATLQLQAGLPYRTAGFDNELLKLDYPPIGSAAPKERLPVVVDWQDAEGNEHHLTGWVQRQCQPEPQVELPLTTLDLERCEDKVVWSNGQTSRNTLWYRPQDQRVWAGSIEPWPDARRIGWQVARPWW
ncbi:YjbF family lipoprotein [Pistricoccus aurantiacus]|uniref:YjbF family lipoprotein n=1 Tax=Pistricoccus aurantiacus TaxID=1883414 RepID=UPI00363C5EE7